MTYPPLFILTVASHFFKLNQLTPRATELAYIFSKRFVQKGLVRNGWGKFEYSPIKVFAASTADRSEFRFHINTLKEFRAFLTQNFISDNLFTEITLPIPNGLPVEIIVKDSWSTRDYQIPYVDYLTNDNPSRSRFLDVPTGYGKGYSSLKAVSIIGKRTVIIVKPKYIEKWADEMSSIYNLVLEDIMVVRGGDHLKALLFLAKENMLDSKFIIISNRTLQTWIKEYEKFNLSNEDMGYPCNPDEMFDLLKAGVRLIDEVHEDFHLSFKIDLYTNVERSISLSATLMNNDPLIHKMQEVLHPTSTRYVESNVKKYIISKELLYSFKDSSYIRTTEYNSPTYSHHIFEQSILKDREKTANYCRLIDYAAKISYFDQYQPGDKMIIFAVSAEMCTVITRFLKEKYKHLDVRRFAPSLEDPYENILEPDIRVTTVLSGGTAHDIPKLTANILTIALSSIQANIQALGRLRDIPNRKTEFIYFTCQDIPKHVDYSADKKKMLEMRAKSFSSIRSPFVI